MTRRALPNQHPWQRTIRWSLVLTALLVCSLDEMDVGAQPSPRPNGASGTAPSPMRMPPAEESAFDIERLANRDRATRRVGQLSDAEASKRGFKISLHEAIARGTVGRACSNILAGAQWNQDVWHFFDSNAHFDNCAFSASIDYINERIAAIDVAVQGSDHKAALKAIGQVLHALQDFHAHSNYVELMAASHAKFSEWQPIRLWDRADQARLLEMGEGSLVSGVWEYSSPKQCRAPALTHEQLAKDSSPTTSGKAPIAQWGMTGFDAAYRMADRTSNEFLLWAFKRWPLLENTCGPVIAYGLMIDRR